jgi:hypothetical protein
LIESPSWQQRRQPARLVGLVDLRHEPVSDGPFAVGQDDVHEKFFLDRGDPALDGFELRLDGER